MVLSTPRTMLAIVLSLLLPSLVVTAVPDGYVLNVKPECGYNASSSARVTVSTDLPFPRVNAECANGERYEFFSHNEITFVLPVFYTDVPSQCVFFKRGTGNLYVIAIFIQWGSPEDRIQLSEEQYYVTCTFEVGGDSDSEFKDVVEALVAPREIQTNIGVDSTSGFTLRMTDILGDDLLQPVDIGKFVKIVATSDGTGGEVGLRALSCDAVGTSSNKTFAILRAGCGDGVIIDKKAGFMTQGLTSTSPHFLAFRLFNDYKLELVCNFTLCYTDCNGSSCNTVPSKRSPEDAHKIPPVFVTLSTAPLALVKNDTAVNQSVHIESTPDPRDDRTLAPLAPFPWECVILSVALAAILIFAIALGRTLVQTNSKEPFKEPIFSVM